MTITSFTYFDDCDSLQLLRIYAGTPPQCYSSYLDYRKTCVLEVPEDAVELYKATDVWKEFKEIKGYFDGELLNDLDYAILKCVYNKLDGANWKKPWDLTNNHRSMGKWQGVVTVGDFITSIDLSAQGLKGELPDSLFLLPRIETLNLSNNRIKGDLTTLLANRSENSTLTCEYSSSQYQIQNTLLIHFPVCQNQYERQNYPAYSGSLGQHKYG